jgi:hypothetical protein
MPVYTVQLKYDGTLEVKECGCRLSPRPSDAYAAMSNVGAIDRSVRFVMTLGTVRCSASVNISLLLSLPVV